jgi:hypothetical protein
MRPLKLFAVRILFFSTAALITHLRLRLETTHEPLPIIKRSLGKNTMTSLKL